MKNCVFGLLILGLTNLMYSQNNIASVDIHTDTYDTYTKSKKTIKNLNYISAFEKEDFALNIKKLHSIVSNYDITSESIYAPKPSYRYTVIFKEGRNSIIAQYNHEGTLISSDEKFVAISLPLAISAKISKEYPGWEFNKTSCVIKYSQNKEALTTYKVMLKKGNKNKSIKMVI